MTTTPPFELFTVRDFHLVGGGVLPQARLAYRLEGDLAAGPPVMTCTAFAATPLDLAYLAVEQGPLDPARRPVLRVEQLGNGRSSSPSNTPPPVAGPDFPAVEVIDNVRLQAALLDHLGIARLHAVVGASMGGQQAVQWAAADPDRAGRAVVIAGNARTTLYGKLFLHTVASALTGDPDFAGGRYTAPPLRGLSRLSETWAPFALSPRFFSLGRHQTHADMAADDLDGFLAKWRTRYHQKDANDLMSHLATWSRFDLAAHTPGSGGDMAAAAARARCPVLFAPISTDIYFHPEDVMDQAALFPRARVAVVDSLSGHAAAFGREPADRATIRRFVEAFLEG